MNEKNVRADALADQCDSHIRDGNDIPDNIDMTLVAARKVGTRELPPKLRRAADCLLSVWAFRHGVDRPHEGR